MAVETSRAYINLTGALTVASRAAEAAAVAATGIGLSPATRAAVLRAFLVAHITEALFRLGRWEEVADIVQAHAGVTHRVVAGCRRRVRRTIALRGRLDDAAAIWSGPVPARERASDPEALSCRGQGRRCRQPVRRCSPPRRQGLRDFEQFGCFTYAAWICDAGIEIEADRVDAARLHRPRDEADTGQCPSVANGRSSVATKCLTAWHWRRLPVATGGRRAGQRRGATWPGVGPVRPRNVGQRRRAMGTPRLSL